MSRIDASQSADETGVLRRLRGVLGLHGRTRLGRGTILEGRLDVRNDGELITGAGCLLRSRPTRSHFVIERGASVIIGDRVRISYGAAVSAQREIVIGSDTRIGPFCTILDNDFHRVGDRESPGLMAPVLIGRNVTIGARVTLLRGARVGDGARIMSGSCVYGVIQADSTVSGVPARAAGRDTTQKHGAMVAAIVRRLFGMTSAPGPLEELAGIPGWQPLGPLRLLLALEESFPATLTLEHVGACRTVADVAKLLRTSPPASRLD